MSFLFELNHSSKHSVVDRSNFFPPFFFFSFTNKILVEITYTICQISFRYKTNQIVEFRFFKNSSPSLSSYIFKPPNFDQILLENETRRQKKKERKKDRRGERLFQRVWTWFFFPNREKGRERVSRCKIEPSLLPYLCIFMQTFEEHRWEKKKKKRLLELMGNFKDIPRPYTYRFTYVILGHTFFSSRILFRTD